VLLPARCYLSTKVADGNGVVGWTGQSTSTLSRLFFFRLGIWTSNETQCFHEMQVKHYLMPKVVQAILIYLFVTSIDTIIFEADGHVVLSRVFFF
jgi:hypothetical protein